MRKISVVILVIALSILSGCGGGGSSGGSNSNGGNGGTTGVTWTAANQPATSSLYHILWTGSGFVAFGSGIKEVSSDGINWAAQVITAPIGAAAWNGSQFVGISANTLYSSPDGTNWTSRLDVGSTGGTINTGVVWANNQFLVLGKDSSGTTTSYISSDGISWTANANSTAATFNDVIWDGTQYVAVGNKIADSTATAAWSADGITWVQSPALATTASFRSVAYNGSVYVVTAPGGASNSDIYTSADGANWTVVHLNNNDFGNRVIWAGNKFVGVGWWWRIMSSVNGSSWTAESPADPALYQGMYSNLYSVAYSGTRYVAVGQDGKILYSN